MDVSVTRVLCDRLRIVLHRDTRHARHVPRMDDHLAAGPAVPTHLPPHGLGTGGGRTSQAQERGSACVGVCLVQRCGRYPDRRLETG